MKLEIVDQYVYAVTQRLPEKQRKDIDMELRGLIEDMLEERAEEGVHETQAVEAVLQELGDPVVLAEKYRGQPRFVIAPELTDAYMMVMKIVAASIGVVLGIIFAINAVIDPLNILDHFVTAIGSIFYFGIPQGLGWVTAVFIVLTLTGVGTNRAMYKEKQKWTLRDLPEIPEKKRVIPISEPIASAIFIIFITLLFVFFAERLGIYSRLGNGSSSPIPFFSAEGLRPYAAGFLAIAALTLAISAWKLRLRRWTPSLAWSYLLTQVASFGFFILVMMDSGVFNPVFMEQLTQLGYNPDQLGYDIVQRIWDNKIMLVLVMIPLMLFDIGQTLYKTYRK